MRPEHYANPRSLGEDSRVDEFGGIIVGRRDYERLRARWVAERSLPRHDLDGIRQEQWIVKALLDEEGRGFAEQHFADFRGAAQSLLDGLLEGLTLSPRMNSEYGIGYRAYLRAIVSGSPAGHLPQLSGEKGEGARAARLDVISRAGGGRQRQPAGYAEPKDLQESLERLAENADPEFAKQIDELKEWLDKDDKATAARIAGQMLLRVELSPAMVGVLEEIVEMGQPVAAAFADVPRHYADAADEFAGMRVKMVDPLTGEVEWEGDAAQHVRENDFDPEVIDALRDLRRTGQPQLTGFFQLRFAEPGRVQHFADARAKLADLQRQADALCLAYVESDVRPRQAGRPATAGGRGDA